jgi:DNA replication protein DnaC
MARKIYLADLAAVPLLIIDDLGMRKLPHTAAEDVLEIIMRRYERTSTLLTSNRPVDDWGKLLGDTAAVTALLDRPPTMAAFAVSVNGRFSAVHRGPRGLPHRN